MAENKTNPYLKSIDDVLMVVVMYLMKKNIEPEKQKKVDVALSHITQEDINNLFSDQQIQELTLSLLKDPILKEIIDKYMINQTIRQYVTTALHASGFGKTLGAAGVSFDRYKMQP